MIAPGKTNDLRHQCPLANMTGALNWEEPATRNTIRCCNARSMRRGAGNVALRALEVSQYETDSRLQPYQGDAYGNYEKQHCAHRNPDAPAGAVDAGHRDLSFRFVGWVRGVASWANHYSAVGGGQRQLRNNRSLSLCSVNASSSSRAGSNRRAGFRSGPNAPNATPILSLKASENRTRALLSPCMRRGLNDFGQYNLTVADSSRAVSAKFRGAK